VRGLWPWTRPGYGRSAGAAWLLSAGGIDNRWLALIVGLVGGAALSRVPIAGGVIDLLVLLLGLGALARGLVANRRDARNRGQKRRTGTGPDESTAD
jgi:hypothetical protein